MTGLLTELKQDLEKIRQKLVDSKEQMKSERDTHKDKNRWSARTTDDSEHASGSPAIP